MNDDDLLLQRALDSELRPNERLELDQRLAQEPRLRARLTELEAMREFRLEARPRGGLGLDFADRVMARCETMRPSPAPNDSVPNEEIVEEAVEETSVASAPAGGDAISLQLRTRLETWILVAATFLVGLGAALWMRNTPQNSLMQASPEVKQEVRELYDQFEERQRRQRLERQLKNAAPRGGENGAGR